MKVKDCMCNDVCCVKPETTVSEVAKLMGQNHIGCIPVCNENNQICGIVTDRDILLRAVACDKDTKTCKVSDIMTCDVCTCQEDEEMSNAQNKMSKHQIRRLPVCDNNNQVVGILTIGDLTHYDTQLGKEQVCNTMENICNCNNNQNAE